MAGPGIPQPAGDPSPLDLFGDTVNLAAPNPEYEQMQPFWRLTSDLYAGTPAMRARGEWYLPRFPAESAEDWAVRLKRTYLYPMFKRSVKTLTGLPFSRSMILEDQGTKLESWLSDIDLDGTDINTFTQDIFERALRDGMTHIYVDMPPSAEGVTLEDEVEQNLRPYLVHVVPDRILGWKWKNVNNVPLLTQVRMIEYAKRDTVDDQFTQEFVTRIRVLEPGLVRLYETDGLFFTAEASRAEVGDFPSLSLATGQTATIAGNVSTAAHSEGWRLVDVQVTRNMPIIPLVTVYFNKAGEMVAYPPLLDAAFLNVQHWQSDSDQQNILHIARVPRQLFTGFDETTPVTADAQMAIKNADVQADAKWIETEGRSIEVGRVSILDIERRSSVLGSEALLDRTTERTATETRIEAAENLSELATFTTVCSTGIREAFILMNMYGGVADPEAEAGKVEIWRDFGITPQERVELDVLTKARAAREITRETYLRELKRRKTLSPELDVDEEIEALEVEAEAQMKHFAEEQAILNPPEEETGEEEEEVAATEEET